MAERVDTRRTATRGRHPSRPAAPGRAPGRTRPSPTRADGGSRAGRADVRHLPGGGRGPAAGGRLAQIPSVPAIGVLVGALCVFGLVMVGSASPVISIDLYGSPWSILIRQSLWMVLGVVGLLVLARLDYHLLRRLRLPLVVGTIALLVVVLVPGLGESSGGSSRWIGFGSFQLQPSELMKLAMAVFTADLITRRSKAGTPPKQVIAPVLAVLAVSALLILKQPDMGTALVLCCIAFAMLFLGGVPLRSLLKVVGTFVALALVAGVIDPYRRDRIVSFLNPGAHASGTGYQVWQSLIGLGSGHLFGLGLGGGREKWGSLPNAHTDFIFSVVGEELGLVGAVALLGLFFALAWYGFRVAVRTDDRFGSLLAVGITTWITAQAVINIGAVIGVLPVTGIPLPFISFGGSSLVINLAAVGILLNIAAHERGRAPAARRRRPARA